MSPTLQQFYIDLQKWIDAGYPSYPKFDKRSGLCGNLYCWADMREYQALKTELKRQFVEAGLNRTTPFNNSLVEYESERNAFFLNSKRLAWVKSHATISDNNHAE